MPIPPKHAAHVLEERKGPHHEVLTEAQEITADVPEENVTKDQQRVDPKKVRPIQMGEFLRKCVSLHSAKVKLQHSRQQCGSSELALKAASKPSPSSTSPSTTNGLQDPWPPRWPDEIAFLESVNGMQFVKLFFPSTLQRQDGSTQPCPMLSKMDFHRCPKIVVQSKEMLTVPSNAV